MILTAGHGDVRVVVRRDGHREGGMLVLSRKRSEVLVIGAEVRVTVLKVERNQVRLGIEAPENVGVFRAELLERGKPSAPPTEAGGQDPGRLTDA
jgi:carbon storage regulator